MYKAQAGLNKAVVTIGGKIKDFRLGSSFQDEVLLLLWGWGY